MYKFSSKRIKPILLACGFFCLGVFSSTVLAMDDDRRDPTDNRRVLCSEKTIPGWKFSLYNNNDILEIKGRGLNGDGEFDLSSLVDIYQQDDRNRIKYLILDGPKKLLCCWRKRKLQPYGCGTEVLPNLKEIESKTLEEIESKTLKTSCNFAKSRLEYVICPKLKSISENCFDSCKQLKRFESNALTKIPRSGFNGCTSLETITSKNIVEIDENGLFGCNNLKEIYTENVEKIGNEVMAKCNSLTVLKFPKLREWIDMKFEFQDCFHSCENLRYIYLGDRGTEHMNLSNDFVENLNKFIVSLLYKVDDNKMVNIVEKCEEGNLNENEKKELVQDLKGVVQLVEPLRLIIIENSDMLNKMTNNTDYVLSGLMSDLYIKDYDKLSENEKKYREDEKRILSEINKQVFIDGTRDGIINDNIINRGSLLRNFNKLFKINLKTDMVEDEIESFDEIVRMWDEQDNDNDH